ncbi:hypothetical protein GGR52DRAFT_365224 [Hypoxylon sp. FL1284]|nr:hypothetical protein GGR52DRAFT_365224 [Hypoxylon sp. FL1284]
MSILVTELLECLLKETFPQSQENDANILHSFFAKRTANDHAVASKALTLILAFAIGEGSVSELQEAVLVGMAKSLAEIANIDVENVAPANGTVANSHGQAKEADTIALPTAASDAQAVSNKFDTDTVGISIADGVSHVNHAADATFQEGGITTTGSVKPDETTIEPVTSAKLETTSDVEIKNIKPESIQEGQMSTKWDILEFNPQQVKDNLSLSPLGKAEMPKSGNSVETYNGEDAKPVTPQPGRPKLLPHEWSKPIPDDELQRMADGFRPTACNGGLPRDNGTVVTDDMRSVGTWGKKTPPSSKGKKRNSFATGKASPRPSESVSQVEPDPESLW